MFDIFDLIGIISEMIQPKSKRVSNIIDTIAGHTFMFAITGGLYIPFAIIMKRRKKRKNKKRA